MCRCLPYTTTMLRTHHFASAEFLSIYEQLSVRKSTNSTGFVEAYNIFPGVAFSMRDGNDTTVLGIRAVYEHNTPANQVEIFYYVTDLNGNERCLSHSKRPVQATDTRYSGSAEIRGGIQTQTWTSMVPNSPASTTTYYVKEARGPVNANGTGTTVQYPFRIQVANAPGSAEIGYVLDHGTHFPLSYDSWFKTGGCPSAIHSDRPLFVTAGNVVLADHWDVLARL
eukprot:m.309679 g.309679  ORF g.309679 m.309679 type:complete len:225 (+) comp23582_c0_seq1:126-800(+)